LGARACFCAARCSRHCSQSQPAVERELLNSERIESVFGSYGLELLTSTPALRVSNLFSTHDGDRICRTFAMAVYPAEVDATIAAEHAAILDGGSIGSTFVDNGWRVVKTHRYVGQIDSTPKLSALMGGIAPTRLAVHVYTLGVTNGEQEIDYATMAEVHHPDYLSDEAVREVYGIVGLSDADRSIQRILAIVSEQTQ
jgi:hypothetical protein